MLTRPRILYQLEVESRGFSNLLVMRLKGHFGEILSLTHLQVMEKKLVSDQRQSLSMWVRPRKGVTAGWRVFTETQRTTPAEVLDDAVVGDGGVERIGARRNVLNFPGICSAVEDAGRGGVGPAKQS